jgi:hypothetical protein
MGTGTGSVLLRSLVIAVLALGAAGCSDDPEKPGTIPAPSPTESSTASTPTATPVEAQVEAIMRAYFAAANRMFQTGSVAELRSFSDASCPCRKITRDVEKVATGGGKYRGTRYELAKIRVHDINNQSALAEVEAHVPAYTVIDGSGKVIENSGGGTLHTDFSLVRRGDRWIVANAVNLG